MNVISEYLPLDTVNNSVAAPLKAPDVNELDESKPDPIVSSAPDTEVEAVSAPEVMFTVLASGKLTTPKTDW